MKIGDSVRVLTVGALPQSLVGKVGRIESFLTANAVCVDIDGQSWGVDTSQIAIVLPPEKSLWIEAGIRRHRRRYARWLRGVHGAYLILKQHPEHLETLIRESDRLIDEAMQFQAQLEMRS